MIRYLILAAVLLCPAIARADAQSSYAAVVVADSPVGYWKLDEASGSSFADSSGNGHTGTKVGSPTMGQTGPIGGSLGLFSSSTSDYATFTNDGGFSVGTGDFSGEIWAKPDATGGPYHVMMGKGYAPGWDLEVSAGGACAGYCDGQFFCNSTNTANVWLHFIVRRTSGAITVYRNAVNDTQGSPSCNISTNNSTPVAVLFIASFSAPTMTVSNFSFYNYSLTTAQVVNHYHCGWSGGCGSPGRKILESRYQQKRRAERLPDLLARDLPPATVDGPGFLVEQVNAKLPELSQYADR